MRSVYVQLSTWVAESTISQATIIIAEGTARTKNGILYSYCIVTHSTVIMEVDML